MHHPHRRPLVRMEREATGALGMSMVVTQKQIRFKYQKCRSTWTRCLPILWLVSFILSSFCTRPIGNCVRTCAVSSTCTVWDDLSEEYESAKRDCKRKKEQNAKEEERWRAIASDGITLFSGLGCFLVTLVRLLKILKLFVNATAEVEVEENNFFIRLRAQGNYL